MKKHFCIEFLYVKKADLLPACRDAAWYAASGYFYIPESRIKSCLSKYVEIMPFCTASYLTTGREETAGFRVEKVSVFDADLCLTRNNDWFLKMFFEDRFGGKLQDDAFYGLSSHMVKMIFYFSGIQLPEDDKECLFMHYIEADDPDDDLES